MNLWPFRHKLPWLSYQSYFGEGSALTHWSIGPMELRRLLGPTERSDGEDTEKSRGGEAERDSNRAQLSSAPLRATESGRR